MPYTKEIVEELNMLVRFSPDSTQLGIKVHQHEASPEVVAATKRLFEKGLITQEDGGYLTYLGHETAEHANALLGLLNA